MTLTDRKASVEAALAESQALAQRAMAALNEANTRVLQLQGQLQLLNDMLKDEPGG